MHLCLLLFIRSEKKPFPSSDSSPRLGLKGFGSEGVKGHLRNVWKKNQKMQHKCRLGPRMNRLQCSQRSKVKATVGITLDTYLIYAKLMLCQFLTISFFYLGDLAGTTLDISVLYFIKKDLDLDLW